MSSKNWKEVRPVERGNRKTRIGKVVSDKMDKTIVVAVETKMDIEASPKPVVY